MEDNIGFEIIFWTNKQHPRKAFARKSDDQFANPVLLRKKHLHFYLQRTEVNFILD